MGSPSQRITPSLDSTIDSSTDWANRAAAHVKLLGELARA